MWVADEVVWLGDVLEAVGVGVLVLLVALGVALVLVSLGKGVVVSDGEAVLDAGRVDVTGAGPSADCRQPAIPKLKASTVRAIVAFRWAFTEHLLKSQLFRNRWL